MSQKSNSALTDNSTPNSAPQSTPAAELLTLRKLAKAIGVDAGQLSKEAGRAGFPNHSTAQGVLYLAAEVLTWRQANVRQKRPGKTVSEPLPAESSAPAMPAEPSKQPTPEAAAASPPIGRRRRWAADEEPSADDEANDADLLAMLESGKASALEISRATVQIAARRVARAGRYLGPQDLDALKKSLQELRSAEVGYIELEERKLQLIPRSVVHAMVGECCSRLVQVTDKLKNAIAMEFAVWLANPEIASMSADERARLVRQYVSKTTAEIRRAEADDVDALLKQSIADAEAA